VASATQTAGQCKYHRYWVLAPLWLTNRLRLPQRLSAGVDGPRLLAAMIGAVVQSAPKPARDPGCPPPFWVPPSPPLLALLQRGVNAPVLAVSSSCQVVADGACLPGWFGVNLNGPPVTIVTSIGPETDRHRSTLAVPSSRLAATVCNSGRSGLTSWAPIGSRRVITCD